MRLQFYLVIIMHVLLHNMQSSMVQMGGARK